MSRLFPVINDDGLIASYPTTYFSHDVGDDIEAVMTISRDVLADFPDEDMDFTMVDVLEKLKTYDPKSHFIHPFTVTLTPTYDEHKMWAVMSHEDLMDKFDVEDPTDNEQVLQDDNVKMVLDFEIDRTQQFFDGAVYRITLTDMADNYLGELESMFADGASLPEFAEQMASQFGCIL